MATYRYSKYDKAKTSDKWLKKLVKSARKRIPSLGRKPLNLKMSDYYSRKTKQAKGESFLHFFEGLGDKLFTLIAISILAALLVGLINWGINDTETLVEVAGSILGFSLFVLIAFCGIWIIYQGFKWRSSCPTCKAPWKRELIDKTFLGTYDTRYDNDSGTIKHRNRYLEKYRCGNCGCTWSQEVTDWL